MHTIASSVMLLTQLLQFSFYMAQLGGLLFQLNLRFVDVAQEFLLLVGGFIFPQEPQQFLLLVLLGSQLMVLLRNLGLLLQLLHVLIQLAQNIFNALQVFAGILQTIFCFAAALFVFRYACSLFQKNPQLFRTRLNDARDHALPNDGVGTRTEAGTQENVLNVATADRLVVDVVRGGAVTRERPLDRNFSERAPLPCSLAGGIVKQQLDGRPTRRLAIGGAVEDDILHRLAA